MSLDVASLRRALCLAISLGIAVLAGIAHGKNVKPPLPDWQALAFTCTTEQNPPVDPQADAWFLRARELEKQGISAHDAEMVRLYQMAADRGHYKAMLNLAGLYVRGIGVDKDEGKAVDLVERAIKLNAPHAFYLMGVMLQQGIGVKQDVRAAMSFFRRSADLGNRYGQAAVGEEIIRAFQRQPEPTKSRGKSIGRKALDCAISQGLPDAAHFLGVDYLIVEKDTSTALEYLQKAAALGSEKSLWRLYEIFDDGQHGVAKDPKRAFCYYELRKQLRADPNRRFPDIDRLCP
ncbi:TPA: sel1 repeat family protein, partial [Pseudomonas aeruginosa]|nr:sel1 repeat family protein [Pseudomonas aeruginosa]HCE6882059.1 sel1 repeat family protein [Pseudomonas aeruginosa]HCE9350872.1 sel1 repeat family protein [Pseudomonas aeruginosa]HCT4783416.1 sel1 repeat family protein [Pseudomonas aeruginosa]